MPEFDNVAIAQLLDLTADLLELSDADKFRFLSYRKAASSIRAWPEQLSVLAEEGRLTDVPGVGAKLAVSIERTLATGTFPEYEDVAAQFPPSLAEVMQIPGVGPKRARLLFERLGVKSVSDLEGALDDHRLDGLPGLGAKSIQSVAAGVETYRRHRSRLLLMDALPVAERIVAELLALPAVERAEPAGSLRRRVETVGDIDVLVASTRPDLVMEEVRTMPLVTRVLGSGETKTSVLTTAGLQVDVRVVEPGAFGAALQYFTGSKTHNVQLREIAKRRGMKVNEYGVFAVHGPASQMGEGTLVPPGEQHALPEQRLGGATEEDVYSLLGMDTPPPELREGLGELEAASEHRLPRLLELVDMRGDLHVHSNSTDSRSSIEENRAKAAELSYDYVAVTDHAYDLRMVGGLSVEQLEAQWAHVDEVNRTPGPRVLKGIELNIGEDGTLDYDDEVLARFDFCIASLHAGWNEPGEVVTRRLITAIEHPLVDIIGHPTGRIIGRRDPIPLDMDAILEAAGRTGTIMEVNAYPDRLDLSDVHLRLARRYGVRFSIDTDAHHAEQMGYMRFGVYTARRGWVTRNEVLNAQPLETLLAWLKRSAGRPSTAWA